MLLLGLEEDLTKIGAVNKRVAHGAGLVFLSLVVGRSDGRLRGHVAQRKGMALQTKQIDLTHSQQTRVGRAVRSVATNATFGLYWQVLENERSLFFGMALETDLILGRAGTQLLRQEASVLVVAIRALHQSLVYPMPVGAAEFGLDLSVALVAKLWLPLHQQGPLPLGMVG